MNQNLTKGSLYTGLGYCGIGEGKTITGKLLEWNHQHDHAILEEKEGMIYAVIFKTLKEVEK
jgi:hypothetical protein